MTDLDKAFEGFIHKSYKADPIEFHETKSPYFNCLFAERGLDLIFQFYRTDLSTDDILLGRIENIFLDCLGALKQALKVEHVVDENIDKGSSIYVEVKGLRNNNYAKQLLFRKPFEELHESFINKDKKNG
jgi:hypothetical protein